jgi:hypothetical protein
MEFTIKYLNNAQSLKRMFDFYMLVFECCSFILAQDGPHYKDDLKPRVVCLEVSSVVPYFGKAPKKIAYLLEW